jgi:hypothetical protein
MSKSLKKFPQMKRYIEWQTDVNGYPSFPQPEDIDSVSEIITKGLEYIEVDPV